MARYVHRPTQIDAWQFDGHNPPRSDNPWPGWLSKAERLNHLRWIAVSDSTFALYALLGRERRIVIPGCWITHDPITGELGMLTDAEFRAAYQSLDSIPTLPRTLDRAKGDPAQHATLENDRW